MNFILAQMCVKEEPECYKLVLNILYMINFVTSSTSVLEVSPQVKQTYKIKS